MSSLHCAIGVTRNDTRREMWCTYDGARWRCAWISFSAAWFRREGSIADLRDMALAELTKQ